LLEREGRKKDLEALDEGKERGEGTDNSFPFIFLASAEKKKESRGRKKRKGGKKQQKREGERRKKGGRTRCDLAQLGARRRRRKGGKYKERIRKGERGELEETSPLLSKFADVEIGGGGEKKKK